MSESLLAPSPEASSGRADDGFDVADFPSLEFSNREVKRAGEVIAGSLVWTEESAPELKCAFQIANNWRDAHAYPMRSVRYQLLWFMRDADVSGFTVARLKRMQAIRRKLRRVGLHLNQIQDLGGCRATSIRWKTSAA